MTALAPSRPDDTLTRRMPCPFARTSHAANDPLVIEGRNVPVTGRLGTAERA